MMNDSRPTRLASLDALRGLLMALMALDHANHFIAQQHSSGEYWGGPFPMYGSTLAFLVRWITHLCAPGFFFLMGAGMVLFVRGRAPQEWSRRQFTGHFCLRGAILIVIELLVVNAGWRLSAGGWSTGIYVGVLSALGAVMILCAPLVRLKPAILLGAGALLTLGTELAMPAPSRWGVQYPVALRLLLIPGGSQALWANYPVLPWLAVSMLGMAFGHWLHRDRRLAFKRAATCGAGFLLAFLPLRALNGFGNLRPRAGGGWIDWLNVVKYPPSLTFLLLTLGLDLLALAAIERIAAWRGNALRTLEILGRVPLFFYVAHLFVYAGIGRLLAPKGSSLPVMIGLWVVGLLGLLYPCARYAELRRRPGLRRVLRYL